MFLVGLSDVISQILTKNNKDRVLRNIRFLIWGLLFGALAHGYLTLINYLIPSRTLPFILLKVAIDQTIWAPISNILFFFIISVLEVDAL